MTVIFIDWPEYCISEFSGEKKVEYRRKPIKNAIIKSLFTLLNQLEESLANLEIDDLICAPPSELWEKTYIKLVVIKESFF